MFESAPSPPAGSSAPSSPASPSIGRSDLRTLFPYARRLFAPVRAPGGEPWTTTLEDPDVGPVRLTGVLRRAPGSRDLFLIVHGLGGSPESRCCLEAALAVHAHGASSLCLALRGSDRRGEDFYNIALTADLHAALASPQLRDFERAFVIGFSMGGYVTLHLAREGGDERVRAVTAISTPLDLSTAQQHIDTGRAWIYRQHVLGGLKAIYAAVAARRPVPTDPRLVARVKTIYEWDRLAIAPRYGFASPEAYYEALSLAPHVTRLQIPALLVAAADDPVIPATTIAPFLPPASERSIEVAWVERAGHLGFKRNVDLGFGAGPGLLDQVLHWLETRG